jgi:hypothetical protein
MQLGRFFVVCLLMLSSCGGDSICDKEDSVSGASDTCVASQTPEDEIQIGDFCDDEGAWSKGHDGGHSIGLRCTQSKLGERSVDRLRCLRSGYEISVSDDRLYAYCVSDDLYSFLYHAEYGSYKPWHCSSTSSADKVKALDSDGKRWTLVCENLIYRPENVNKSEEGTSSSQGNETCSTEKESEVDVFAVHGLQDFDPVQDQVEKFDTSAYCDTPTDTSANPADNVSGSFLRWPNGG